MWKGIPFAAAPVGALRWQPPQAPTSWTDAKNTSAFVCTICYHYRLFLLFILFILFLFYLTLALRRVPFVFRVQEE